MDIRGKTANEISNCIRQMVETGMLAPSTSLPPVRELAEQLGVNRNTVAAAYKTLTQAHIVTSRRRAGTVVLPPAYAGAQEGVSLHSTLIDLADGNPDASRLPDPNTLMPGIKWKRFLYGEETILPELGHYGSQWLNPDCPPGMELVLTHGAVDAIERLCAAHLVPGDMVAVEDPCFMGTINAIRLAGMRTVGIAIDEAGMKPAALRAALDRGVRAVLITPRAHNPTGCSLTRERAAELMSIFSHYPNVLIVADDHFALLADSPFYPIIPDSTLRWALIRSVSKGFGPDLRVAFVGCDATTASRLKARLAPGMSWVSHILQGLVSHCLSSHTVRSSLEATRRQYTEQKNRMRTALMREGISVAPVFDGFNVWIPLDKDQENVAHELEKQGWLVRTGNTFDVQGTSNAIRVTVSRLNNSQCIAFAQALKASLA